MKIFVRLRKRRKEEFQFFMHDFVDACVEHGFETKPDVMPSYRWHLRAVCRDILWIGYRLIGKLMPGILRRKHALLVTANGNTICDSVFPYYGCCEIVPMLWDVWPNSWGTMFEMLRELGVKTVLVSSHQVAEMINRETQVKAFWIPEGIKAKLYHRGLPLAQREYDVYEMGRRYEKYHMVLQDMKNEGAINQLLTSNLTNDGTLSSAMSVSIDDFYDNISRYKVMICFPQCDTNPRRAGDIETLTQRYWEAFTLWRSIRIDLVQGAYGLWF